MPMASDELRAKMNEYFGDPIDDAGPIDYLRGQGFKLNRGFWWSPRPGVTALSDLTEKERDCILFLIDEWDWDGLVLPK